MTDYPAPLTPADCDLRGLPFMPLDVVRLVDSDLMALTTGEEFKAAVMLWCKSWLQVPAASLPDDDRVLAHLSGTGTRWRKMKAQALRGFVLCSDGRWYHPVVAEKARDAWKHRQKQREKANRRWGNTDDQGSGTPTEDAAACPTADADVDATACAAAMQGRGRGRGTVITPVADATGGARTRARRLPPNWEPDPLSGEAAKVADRRGPDWEAKTLESFRNHWAANGERKLDWNAAWRNWVTRQDEYDGRKSGTYGGQSDVDLLARSHPGGRTGAAFDFVQSRLAGN